ncbi:MAG: hypothetical protein ACREPS_01060 [Rhodanobacteraceae bacterium]
MATLLAACAVGIAHATPTDLITNGDFSQSSHTAPWQFGTNSGGGQFFGGGSCTYGGNSITGWQGNGGYEIWYNSSAAASTVEPCTQYSETQLLSPISAPPAGAGSGSFVGLDGISSPIPNAGISQMINGLVAGAKYTVTFYWGNTQLLNRSGPTTEYLTVSLGSQSFDTSVNSIGTHGWSGWAPVSFTFTADSASELLGFLSIGTPDSLPPFAVLTGISMYQDVPEPSDLATFGGGLLGLGLLIVFARRREMRRRAAEGNNAIS